MTVDFSAISNILTQSPGNLVYHLLTGIPLLILVLLANRNRHSLEKSAAATQVLIGSGILLILQLILSVLDLVFSPGIFSKYPPFAMIERIIDALVVIWAIWVILENNHRKIKTSTAIFLSIFIVFFGTASILLNNFDSMVVSEIVRLHLLLWQVVTLFFLLVGMILVFVFNPSQKWAGVAILLLLGCGYLFQIFAFDPTDIGMGWVRLSQVLALPWLLVMTQRFSGGHVKEEVPQPIIQEQEQQERVDIKPILVNDLLAVSLQEKKRERQESTIRAISLCAKADICYLVEVPDSEEQVNILIGYDLIRDIIIPPTTLERYELPLIVKAWEAKRFIKLSQADIDTQDAITLTGLQNYRRIGKLLAYPLSLPDQALIGGIIFLSPYTDRSFEKETIPLMEKVHDNLTQILFGSKTHEDLSNKLEELRQSYAKLLDEKQSLSGLLAEKDARIKELEIQVKEWQAKFQIEKMDCSQRIDHMKEEITRLTLQTEEKSSTELEQLRAEIRQLIEQRDHIQAALREANARIAELETLQGQTGPIRLSMENQIISLDAIAANVRMALLATLNQKHVDLEISNPQGRAMIKTDPGLLHSVLQNLLINAIQASSEGGRALLSMDLSYETGMLIMQITDYGPGLTPDEQSALFSTEPPEIGGIGSLASIREAVRAIRVLNGKIWLKSKKDISTTFRVQLPVRIID